MDRTKLLEGLREALPVVAAPVTLPAEGNVGLVLVDIVRGFTRQGNLADARSMAPMVGAVDELARRLLATLGPRLRLLVLRDTHHGDVPEPPYPPHCIRGTGEEELDPEIAWVAEHDQATVLDKDAINGLVGGLERAGGGLWRSRVTDWAADHDLRCLVLVGDCTDICVSDLAVSLLSARNHGMLTRADPDEDRAAYAGAIRGTEIVVYAPGCATYHLDPDDPLPEGQEHLRHPATVAHHVGLWICQSRGARVASEVMSG